MKLITGLDGTLDFDSARRYAIGKTLYFLDYRPIPASTQTRHSVDASYWQMALQKEYDVQITNHTWTLIDLPPNRPTIGCCWGFHYQKLSGFIIVQSSTSCSSISPGQRLRLL